MAKRGLSVPNEDGVRKTPDWSGDEEHFRNVALGLYEAEAPRPKQRFLATLIRRIKPAPKPN